jgi:hypothetical protein
VGLLPVRCLVACPYLPLRPTYLSTWNLAVLTPFPDSDGRVTASSCLLWMMGTTSAIMCVICELHGTVIGSLVSTLQQNHVK